MNVILFGATGMVGQAALRECLLDPEVKQVLSVVRNPTGQHDAKLRELVHNDLFDYAMQRGTLPVSAVKVRSIDPRMGICRDMTLTNGVQ